VRLKARKPIIVVLALIFLLNFSVYSIDNEENISGFVVSSPIYSNFDINELDALNIEQQTFNEQLGLIELDLEIDPSTLLLMAISDSNYPITPGDTFRIDYLDGDQEKELVLQVDSEYNVNIPLIGTIDAEDMVLTQLVETIKNNISTYYAFSSPQVSLISIGVFSVKVIGEVSTSSTFAVNGLTRLSEVVKVASAYANTRDIQIIDKYGNIKHYDLYLALKKGEIDQNPLLKAGDTVVLRQADKLVNVYGNIYKPGTFQPKESETLQDILSYYAGGLLSSADLNNILISRYDVETNTYQQIRTNYDSDIKINNLDKIIIPNIPIVQNSITIEGAIVDVNSNSTTTASLLGMSRGSMIYKFFPGETLNDMLKTISGRFTSTSDLAHSYLIRDDKRISVNLLSYLENDIKDDFVLEAGDRLIIPFDQKYVNVQGEVERANAYTYEPNKKVSYYIALAGGKTDDASNKIRITDSNGNQLGTDEYIPSGATIYVEEDKFSTNITTVASIVSIIYYSALIINTSLDIFGVN
jgi:protein involved in polysaccharide export with SLBB domain